MRTELTNNICLWYVFSRWTFDRCLKNFIFMQHRSKNVINIKSHSLYQVFNFFYIGIVCSILLFWHILMWLSGKRAHSLPLPLSNRGVLNIHEVTYLLTNTIPNYPLLQNPRYENDITTTNSTKLFLIYMSEIIIQCLEFSGIFSWLGLSLIMEI